MIKTPFIKVVRFGLGMSMFLLACECRRNDKIIVFSDIVFALRAYAKKFGK